ncbi:MAG: ice-binding family protein [Candidatus Micrarchaeota archaeon]|nr:ice-binding family protein [Candidatus Micrarchaeota archaeon]
MVSYKTIFSFAFLFLFLVQIISAAGPAAVNLGTAGNFVILSKSGISTTGTTYVTGDMGVSPIDSTGITGFGLIADSSNTFSRSSLVTGKIHAPDYTPPTPTAMTTTIGDMEIAYTDAAGRTNPTATELGAGDISGMTIAPGLYKWGTGVIINNGVTLSGSSNDVWIFQIAQDLDVGNGAIITLSGGAQAKNVFWQVAGQATLGTTSDFKGIILSQTAIVLNTGAKLNGRALAQTAVTLDANMVTAPSGSTSSALIVTPIVNPKVTSTNVTPKSVLIPQCVVNSDCSATQNCALGSCSKIGCSGQIVNHICVTPVITPVKSISSVTKIYSNKISQLHGMIMPINSQVGANAIIKATGFDGNSCIGCNVLVTSPKGSVRIFKIGALGSVQVSVTTAGTYKVSLLKGSILLKNGTFVVVNNKR